MHAFDLDKFGSKEVVVRRAADKEKFKTLDGDEHELTPEVLLITNGKKAVAAGGVMGGFDSEVEDNTKNLLLEAAYFNPSMIRKSRRQLGLVTESSQRFEKGADPNAVENALDYAAYLLQSLCGGEVLSGIVDCYPNKISPKTVPFRVSRCNDLLGTDIKPASIKNIFTDLEFTVTGENEMKITVPTFRPDIEREVDLIEEVARIVGFDAIEDAVTNIGPLYTPTHYDDRFRTELRTVLTGAGYDEFISHGLADSKLAEFLHPERPLLKIVNPVSEELNVMRNCLAQTALTVISHNLSHRSLDLSIFEIGKTYLPPDSKGHWAENEALVLAVTGKTEHSWREKPRERDFYDISGAVKALADHFGWSEVTFTPKPVSFFTDKISYEITINGKQCGFVGQLTSTAAKKFGVKQQVFLAELDAEYLFSISNNLITYKELPVYPAALRDLALVVEESVLAGDIIAQVKKSAGKIAESVQIFDLYQGKQIEKGKKSIAISISYRSDKGSLESSQIDAAQDKVIASLKKNFNAEVRDK